jgi:hypothetical protein
MEAMGARRIIVVSGYQCNMSGAGAALGQGRQRWRRGEGEGVAVLEREGEVKGLNPNFFASLKRLHGASIYSHS